MSMEEPTKTRLIVTLNAEMYRFSIGILLSLQITDYSHPKCLFVCV